MADLRVNFCGVELKNPITTASGTFGFGHEYGEFFDLSMLGGIGVKGLTPTERLGNPAPRIAETPQGILNCVGLQNPGIDRFIKGIRLEIEPRAADNLLILLDVLRHAGRHAPHAHARGFGFIAHAVTRIHHVIIALIFRRGGHAATAQSAQADARRQHHRRARRIAQNARDVRARSALFHLFLKADGLSALRPNRLSPSGRKGLRQFHIVVDFPHAAQQLTGRKGKNREVKPYEV